MQFPDSGSGFTTGIARFGSTLDIVGRFGY